MTYTLPRTNDTLSVPERATAYNRKGTTLIQCDICFSVLMRDRLTAGEVCGVREIAILAYRVSRMGLESNPAKVVDILKSRSPVHRNSPDSGVVLTLCVVS
jgi:hypothetical protein